MELVKLSPMTHVNHQFFARGEYMTFDRDYSLNGNVQQLVVRSRLQIFKDLPAAC